MPARAARSPPRAQVGPDVTLGDGCTIGAGAVVRDSSSTTAWRSGRARSSSDSIVGPSARIAAGARLEGETIVGEGTAVPPGAHLVGGRLPADG